MNTKVCSWDAFSTEVCCGPHRRNGCAKMVTRSARKTLVRIPQGESPWGIPQGDFPRGIPPGGFPLGDSPWGIPLGDFPWDSPGFPLGISPGGIPLGDPPWALHNDVPGFGISGYRAQYGPCVDLVTLEGPMQLHGEFETDAASHVH